MSLPGTPHSSSGGDDDFAALLDLELQAEESDHDEEEEEEGGDHTAAAAAGVVVVADEDKEHENGAAAKEEEPAARRNAAECPPHPGFMGGMCIRCGALRGPSEAVEDGVALRYIHAVHPNLPLRRLIASFRPTKMCCADKIVVLAAARGRNWSCPRAKRLGCGTTNSRSSRSAGNSTWCLILTTPFSIQRGSRKCRPRRRPTALRPTRSRHPPV